MTGVRAVAAWTGPAVFVSVAARVLTGDREAPFLAFALLIAPLVALVATARDTAPPGLAASLAALAGMSLGIAASLRVLADLGAPLGLPRPHAVAVTIALTALLTLWPAAERWWTLAVPLGVAGLAIPLIVMGAALAVPPWAAWSQVASRPALVFGERSAWVTDGRSVTGAVTLGFTEPHRVTALGPTTFRVVERDGARTALREWRLAAGDALTLRPGDSLALEAGARVRFEAGKRVPGAALSGVAWADPPERRSPAGAAHALGATVTMVAGAVGLAAPRQALGRAGALAAPLVLLTFALAAACWGVYGAYVAPELAVGGPTPPYVLESAAVAVASPWGRTLVVLGAAALLALFVAASRALRDRVRDVTGGARELWVWAGLFAAGSLASFWPAEPWRVWLAGAGLVAAVGVAPRLAGGGPRAELIGALVGAAAFAGVGSLGRQLPAWAVVVGLYPALVAGPLAWGAARLAAAMRR